MDSAFKTLVTFTLAFFLYSCGGSGGSNNGSNPDIDYEFEVSPGGIWYTIPEPFIFESSDFPFPLPVDSRITAVTAISDEEAYLTQLQNSTTFFIGETGKLFIQHHHDAELSLSIGQGQITSSNSSGVEGSYQVETIRVDFDDITTGITPIIPVPGLCQLDGTLVEGSALYLSSTCEYEDGTEETYSLDLVAAEDCSSGFCSISTTAYENPFSLEEIAGNYNTALIGIIYSGGDPIERLEISASGVISGSNGLNAGCAIDGQISFVDEAFNLYEVSWTLSECEIPQADGTEINGLAAVRAFGDNLYLETIVQIESDEENGPNVIALKRNYLRLVN